MRSTIDFGIDLGTTNSVIAVADRSTITIVKNDDNADSTPSAVWMPSGDMIEVGRRAKERLESDPENAHAEFKLEMGISGVRRQFRDAGREMSPAELSAEILKALKTDANQALGEIPTSAVITVPAAFGLHQNEATGEAARLAGLADAPLIQEPNAAAFAYGLHERPEGYYLVFDLGGGTFDAAIVRAKDGRVRVVNHAGDRNLGGKLIDRAIIDRIFTPHLVTNLGDRLPTDGSGRRSNDAKLKAAAEDAKIVLSRRQETTAFLTLELEDGTSVAIECDVKRSRVEDLAAPLYARAVHLCRQALKESRLSHTKIDRVLLVGSATMAPSLRERLPDPDEGLGIEIDFSQDPATAVARGAAAYANTKKQPGRSSAAAGRSVPGSPVEVALDVTPRTESGDCTISGSLSGSPQGQGWTGYRISLHDPGREPAFHSPQRIVTEAGAFAISVPVDARAITTFDVELTDAEGAPVTITPQQVDAPLPGDIPPPLLTHSVGVGRSDHTCRFLLEKGSELPTKAVHKFRTTRVLRRDDDRSVIRVPIVEGERRRADRNLQVGRVNIRAKDARIELPEGSDVQITVEVDVDRRLKIVADIPMLNTQVEADIDLSDVVPPDAVQLALKAESARDRLNELRRQAAKFGAHEAQLALGQLDERRKLDAVGYDDLKHAEESASAAVAAEQGIRDFEAELDDIEDRIYASSLLVDIRNERENYAHAVQQSGDQSDRKAFESWDSDAAAASEEDPASARKILEKGIRERIDVARKNPDWPIQLFAMIRRDSPFFAPREEVNALLAKGDEAIHRQDMVLLTEINAKLLALRPSEHLDDFSDVSDEL